MVRDEEGSLAFRHELARRAIEDSLSQTRLRGLHAKVLAALAARPAISAARLAHHADGARDTAAVLHFAPQAASQAALVGGIAKRRRIWKSHRGTPSAFRRSITRILRTDWRTSIF